MMLKMSKFLRDSKGATAIEYALIVSLIGIVLISGVRFLGNTLLAQMNNITENIGAAMYGAVNDADI